MMATPRPMEWTSVLLSVNCLMAAVPRQPGQSRLSRTAERVDGTGRRRLWLRWLCWSGLALVQGWDSPGAGPVQSVTAAAPETSVQEPPVREIALQGLDEEQWEYMSRYLLEHAQHNSVGAGRGAVGYARLVSANGAGY